MLEDEALARAMLEHVAIELQNVAGEDVTFGKTRSIDERPGIRWFMSMHSGGKALLPVNWPCACCGCSLLPPAIRPADSVPEDWNWPESARRLHPATRSACARAFDGFAGQGRRERNISAAAFE